MNDVCSWCSTIARVWLCWCLVVKVVARHEKQLAQDRGNDNDRTPHLPTTESYSILALLVISSNGNTHHYNSTNIHLFPTRALLHDVSPTTTSRSRLSKRHRLDNSSIFEMTRTALMMVFALRRACVQPMHDTLCPALCTAAISISPAPLFFTRAYGALPPTLPTLPIVMDH